MRGITRRDVLRRVSAGTVVSGAMLLVACGQGPFAPPRVPRIGFLWSNPRSAFTDLERAAFESGLGEYGYLIGQNLQIEWRYPAGTSDADFTLLASELVDLPVDVIVTVGTPPVIAAQQATRTIPIVMASIGDPVRAGVVPNLARPGGNVTGLSQMNPGLSGRRIDLIHQISPGTTGIAFVHEAGNPTNLANLETSRMYAEQIGMRVIPVPLRTVDDIEPATAAAVGQGAGAIITPGTGAIPQDEVNAGVVEQARRYGLLSMGLARGFAESGGLLSYGADILTSFRRAGYYVDRILKQTSPADLPIEQPTAFELVINLRTARELGLTLPEHVLIEATELIE